LDDVIGSRTFCLYEDIEKIKKAGLAKGGSLDNAVVVNGSHVMNKGGLRNKKEFVNHKILDLAGDFLLSGYRILGSVLCKQGGHELSNMFLRKLIEKHKSSYECFEINNTIISGKENSNSSIKIAINA
jgi:UDP-3-O-[3-hydroxymyristoyl] N-acetylglucosamine deacetylase